MSINGSVSMEETHEISWSQPSGLWHVRRGICSWVFFLPGAPSAGFDVIFSNKGIKICFVKRYQSYEIDNAITQFVSIDRADLW